MITRLVVLSNIVCILLITNLVDAHSNIDLSNFPSSAIDGFSVTGTYSSSHQGYSVNTAGDINSDGVEDFIVGGELSTYVVYGVSNGTPVRTLNSSTFSTGTDGFAIISSTSDDQMGYAASGLGDFNGDGRDDLFVSQPMATVDQQTKGKVFIIYGKDSGSTFGNYFTSQWTSSSSTGVVFTGANENDMLGAGAGPAGDFNDDGIADICLGASGYNDTRGIAYVVFGNSQYGESDMDMSTWTSSDSVGFAIHGVSQRYAQLFKQCQTLGDMNGDGVDDLIMSGYNSTVSGTLQRAGAAAVLFGKRANEGASFPDVYLDGMIASDTIGFTMFGAAAGDQFGYSVGGAGDVNGDGYDDALIGALFHGSAQSGAVYLMFGMASGYSDIALSTASASSTTFVVYSFDTATFPLNFGASVAGVGDVNGDSVDDFAIGAPLATATGDSGSRADAGAVYVLYGLGTEASYSNFDMTEFTTGEDGFKIEGALANDQWGYALGSGDFNGDDLNDLLVSAPTAAVNGVSGAGAAYVLYGDHAPTQEPTAMPTPIPSHPTTFPTAEPTAEPTAGPSPEPTAVPTAYPSFTQPQGWLESKTYQQYNLYGFAAINPVTSRAVAWGSTTLGGDVHGTAVGNTSRALSAIVAGHASFVGATATGGAVGWGREPTIRGVSNYSSASNIVANSIVANGGAYAGITTGMNVVAFGSDANGGNVRDDSRCNGFSAELTQGHAIQKLVASAASFAALTLHNTLYVWGNRFAAAGTSTTSNADLENIRDVVATTTSFAVLKYDGTVKTFGDQYTGGDSSAVSSKLTGVAHILSGKSVFVALKGDGSVVTWGHPTRGGDSSKVSSSLRDITFVANTDHAFAAVRSDGRVFAWGESAYGGDTSGASSTLRNVSRVIGNSKAFAALTYQGKVITWGAESHGGSLTTSLQSQLSSGVVSLHATRRAFAALKTDGSVVVWGNQYQGGNAYAAASYLTGTSTGAKAVRLICANEAAFSALTTDGKIIMWGHMTVMGGETGGKLVTSSSQYRNITNCAGNYFVHI